MCVHASFFYFIYFLNLILLGGTLIFLLVFLMQVEKQCAHFFGVTINEQQAQAGIVVRVTSAAQSKFKVYNKDVLIDLLVCLM